MTFEPLKMDPIELPLTRGEVRGAAWGTLREIFSVLPVWFVVGAVLLLIAGWAAGRSPRGLLKIVVRALSMD